VLDWVGALTGAFSVGGTNGLRTGAETGTDLDLFELGGNLRWDVSQFNASGFVAVVAVVPEPSRMLLLMLGLAGLLLRRRRRA
jgi:fibronectin-binding autotransporter adhesin